MNMFEKLLRLYKEKKQVELLSIVYLIIMVAVVVLAGLVALINQAVGVAFLIIPLIALVALSMNVVMWSLIRLGLDALCTRLKHQTLNVYAREDVEDEELKAKKIAAIEAKIDSSILESDSDKKSNKNTKSSK